MMHWVGESINCSLVAQFHVSFAMLCPIIYLFDDEYLMYVHKYPYSVNLVIEILFFATLSKGLLKAVVQTKKDSSEDVR